MNYLNSFKCVTVLQGNGTITHQETNASTTTTPGVQAAPASMTARYYKLGSITHPNQVPRH